MPLAQRRNKPSDQLISRFSFPSFSVIFVPRSPEPTRMMFGSTLRMACYESFVLQHVLVELHVAKLPGSPHFVADAPVFDAVRLRMAVLDAPRTADRILRAVRILDFLCGRVVVAEAGVDGNHWLGVDFVAEVEEFVEADVV